MDQLKDQVAVITGGASGIGAATAERFAREGATVLTMDVAGDADFSGGRDTVHYEVAAAPGAGPFTVEAALLYQPVGARFAAELFSYRTPEVAAFQAYYQAADRRPELVSEVTASAN